MGPKNVLHRTGFRGMLPIFHSQAQFFNPFGDLTRVNNDFDPHTNTLLGHSENIFNRLEHIFERELPPHHHHMDEDEHHSFKHRDHEHGHGHHHDEMKKMKMDHEMEKIA